MNGSSDTQLVKRSAAGDAEAFAELVKRHERLLFALIRYHVQDRHHAEDILQETLLQAWAGIGRLRKPRSVRAWLLQVARNRCRDFHKSSQRRHKPTDERELGQHRNRNGRAVWSRVETAGEVADALDRVPASQAEAARLFYLHGLTIREISRRCRCPEGTVKRRLFHARRRLRRELRQDD